MSDPQSPAQSTHKGDPFRTQMGALSWKVRKSAQGGQTALPVKIMSTRTPGVTVTMYPNCFEPPLFSACVSPRHNRFCILITSWDVSSIWPKETRRQGLRRFLKGLQTWRRLPYPMGTLCAAPGHSPHITCNFLASPFKHHLGKKRGPGVRRNQTWGQVVSAEEGSPQLHLGRPSLSLSLRGEQASFILPPPCSLPPPRPSLSGLVVVEQERVSGQNEDFIYLFIISIINSLCAWFRSLLGGKERGKKNHYVFAQTAIQSRRQAGGLGLPSGVGRCVP